MVSLDERDEHLLGMAIRISMRSREHGNHPFGALLADSDGVVLAEAENTVSTSADVTGHAEMNLVRSGTRGLGSEALTTATLYSSAEPCAMCAGAIYWAGIGRVIFAMAEADLRRITGAHPDNPTLALGCRAVFASGQHEVEVIGPVLEERAIAVHRGFWDR